MLNRDQIIKVAATRCLTEMYDKAQPRADYCDYLEKMKTGEIGRDEQIKNRHYLGRNQFLYILEKHKIAFRCVNDWKNNIDLLIEFLKDGGLKDCWIYNKDGGYRSAEITPTLYELIGDENAEKVINLIEDLKKFYKFDKDEEKFLEALNDSPISDANAVKEYWASKGISIEIDETELSMDDYWEIEMFGHLLREVSDDLEENWNDEEEDTESDN
jgi:hypothetical protein